MSTGFALLLALLMDAALGEPRWLWSRVPHPAVVMGRLIGWADERFNAGDHRIAKGAVLILALVFLAGLVGYILSLVPLLDIVVAAILLAHRSLVDHVSAVARALGTGLREGRAEVGKIVGRDTADMTPDAVARAAIESAAENFSDGVVAPAFWFLIGGLPAMLIYKMVNTADSMIGYRTDRYAQFGWAAARLDDLLNLVPARLTALILTGLYGLWPATSAILAEARRHRSPNAGWPEAAAARALGVALSGRAAIMGRCRIFPMSTPRAPMTLARLKLTVP